MSFDRVLMALQDLEQDVSTPKGIRAKISDVIKVLNVDGEKSIKVSRVLSQLEELADDVNIEADTRTQIFNIVSLLEVV